MNALFGYSSGKDLPLDTLGDVKNCCLNEDTTNEHAYPVYPGILREQFLNLRFDSQPLCTFPVTSFK